ncbi:factor H binding family protein [Neisseria sp. Dent CA1/247]|uniref:factor H binding family protein n=1 Tax=Neisseria sp. Dent CA1/247 TaxID=2912675 RepID=UPI001FD006B7|nr:factor H binding family protein [Neisseria sp. Dent CA1/247]UOO77448.1 factor H binding family protein [Neisseria sp. Dent CA1/247]
MSIHKKIGLATFIALGLAACGSGGSDGPSAAATPNAAIQPAKIEQVANAGSAGKTVFKVNEYTIKLGETTHKVADMKKGEVVNWKDGNNNVRAYRQAYSVVAGKFDLFPIADEGGKVADTIDMPMEVALINGEATQKLPTEGKYTYKGAAFGRNETGSLTYNVDFEKRVGSGTVTGLNETGTIELKEAGIVHTAITNALDGTQVRAHGVRGETMSEKLGRGDYNLHFFGNNAEEVAGKVMQKKGSIGIAGQR